MLINFKPVGKNRWTVRVNGRKVGHIQKMRGCVITRVPVNLVEAARLFVEQVG